IQLPFRQWDGAIGPWREHFGKGRGQVYSLDGLDPCRSCNEVEVAKILRSLRDHAFWVSGFGTTSMPTIWRPWARAMRELPPWLNRLNEAIRSRVRIKGRGIPDVVAWSDEYPIASA